MNAGPGVDACKLISKYNVVVAGSHCFAFCMGNSLLRTKRTEAEQTCSWNLPIIFV